MGLLDLPAPLFAWLDGALLGWMPALWRVVLWGALAGVVSMLLYAVLSPQARIGEARARAAAARRRMATYDGEFSGLGRVAGESLWASLRHVGLVVVPAVVASLPVLCLLVWLSNVYGYRWPEVGSAVAVDVTPAAAAVGAEGGALVPGAAGAYRIAWPAAGGRVTLVDGEGRPLTAVPPPAPVPVIAKRQWWNAAIGNPAGYLPRETEIEAVRIGLPPIDLVAAGPAWLRGWEAVFIGVLLVVSVAVKLLFRIQ